MISEWNPVEVSKTRPSKDGSLEGERKRTLMLMDFNGRMRKFARRDLQGVLQATTAKEDMGGAGGGVHDCYSYSEMDKQE